MESVHQQYKPNKIILFISKLAALALVIFISISIIDFPAYKIPLSIALVSYAILLWRFSHIWLIVLPALLPILDLTPWTGRILVTEFDFFILSTIAVALWECRFSFVFYKNNKIIIWLLIGLIFSYLISTINGYLQLPEQSNAPFYIYHSALNSLHISKGFFSALFFLPLLAFEKQHNKTIGQYFSTGILLALGFGIISILWERLFFAGLTDFSSAYHISGLFSGMLLGGEIFDGFLVLSFPFFIICFYAYQSRLAHSLGLAFFSAGLYVFLVTFTRTNYLALLVIILILYIGQKKLTQQTLKQINTFLVLALISLAIIIPVFSGGFIQKHFNSSLTDFQHRVSHWSNTIEIMKTKPESLLFGIGKGTFPAQYYKPKQLSLSSFKLYEDNGLNFIHFSPSDKNGNLFIRQRLPLNETGIYTVSITLRSFAKKTDKLLVEYCQRSLFPNQPECNWQGFRVPDNKIGEWITISKPLNSSHFSYGFFSLFKPFEISLMNRGLKSPLDIAKVEITTASTKQIIKNPAFNQGFDHWFFSSGNHLSWHIKNQWLAAFYDGGIIELFLYSALLISLLIRLYRYNFCNNYYNLALFTSLCAFITISFFGSPLDDPKIIWLLFLFIWLAIIQPEKIRQTQWKTNIPWSRLIMGLFLILLLSGSAVFLKLMYDHKISARQLLLEGEKRSGFNLPQLRKYLSPPAKFIDTPLDGIVKTSHPRIILPELAVWNGIGISPMIKQRIALYKKNKMQFTSSCHSKKLLFIVSCWLENNKPQYAQAAIKQMIHFKLNPAKAAGSTSNVWRLALAYDLTYPTLSKSNKQQIEQKIIQGLKDTFVVLDENSSSLWHTRFTHASIAWIAASVLTDNKENHQLQQRAQGHFINAVNALAFTEIWPGGYNYWIQNRAFLFALASSAYINSLSDAKNTAQIKNILHNTAYWHIYATRPDNRIEGFADEGSRIDLKDETRRFIDLAAQLTKDPVLAGYSSYLAKLHGRESYYRGYRWGFLLFNDPKIVPLGDGTIESLGLFLPKSRLFGKKSTNYAYIRSGWGKNDTFISFKAGHSFSHHGHYDAGHFTLFKTAPLAVNSSSYNGVFTENRLNYSIRTIAKNSLLIIKPDEQIQPNHFFKENINAGGQRITQPTGNSLLSIAHWLEQYKQNSHLEGAELLHYKYMPEQYTFISTDLTPAYNNTQYDENNSKGKVSKVIRNLLYLTQNDQLIIYDHIKTTNANYKKKWLLHTINRPIIDNLNVLKGELDNGISQSHSSTASIINSNAQMQLTKLLPKKAIMKLIGGKDYQYYIETDGNDSIINGKNFNQGVIEKKWFDNSLWRIEISPEKAALEDDFIIVLSPNMNKNHPVRIKNAPVLSGNAIGIEIEKTMVIFAQPDKHKKIIINIPVRKNKLLLIGANHTIITLFNKDEAIYSEQIKKHIFLLNIKEIHANKIKIRLLN